MVSKGMEKFDKMVQLNQAESQEKIARAIKAIIEMEQAGEKLQICELTRRTGLSRGFFYKNTRVRNELNRVMEVQKGKVFQSPRQVILDAAMNKQIGFLHKQLEKKDKQIKELEAENEKLTKALNRKELAFIRHL